ncbi:YIP1 family protein [Alkalicoccus luteus]|uniref:Yip1 domain-containing protein n=1 Tax=Alkalicoccus luteus TaxID=1237094 RepID=A0A969PN92_9BACI|nr:YIP1 family protein [Alkalicoccus luteus]NJP37340.1 hypothetical protein [Alkalicoccus luteus]
MTVARMLLMQQDAYQTFLEKENSAVLVRLLVLTVGLLYGIAGILANLSFIADFDAAFLQYGLAPLIFIMFGLFTAWLSRLGLGLLLWAGARGFGGPGRVRDVSRMSSVMLVPGLLAVPLMTGLAGGPAAAVLTAAGVAWMTLAGIHVLMTTQQFSTTKAAAAAVAVIIFFSSIFYLILP